MTETVLRFAVFLTLASLFALAATSATQEDRSVFPRWSGETAVFVGMAAFVSMLPAAGGVFAWLSTAAALACAAICAATDVQCGYAFDRVTLPGAILTIAFAAAGGGEISAIAGACCAGGALLGLWFLTRRRGIGLGDVKLAASIGAAVGPALAFTVLGVAFVLGALVACAGLITQKIQRGSIVRFAPYLAASLGIVIAGRALAK